MKDQNLQEPFVEPLWDQVKYDKDVEDILSSMKKTKEKVQNSKVKEAAKIDTKVANQISDVFKNSIQENAHGKEKSVDTNTDDVIRGQNDDRPVHFVPSYFSGAPDQQREQTEA